MVGTGYLVGKGCWVDIDYLVGKGYSVDKHFVVDIDYLVGKRFVVRRCFVLSGCSCMCWLGLCCRCFPQ